MFKKNFVIILNLNLCVKVGISRQLFLKTNVLVRLFILFMSLAQPSNFLFNES